MSPTTIALIVVAISVAGWALFMANITIRRQRKARAATDTHEHPAAGGTDAAEPSAQKSADTTAAEATSEPAPKPKPAPLTPEQMAVSRRQFLNRAWGASFGLFLGFFGMSSLSFLWPKLTGGF